jgi:hypothetical protein
VKQFWNNHNFDLPELRQQQVDISWQASCRPTRCPCCDITSYLPFTTSSHLPHLANAWPIVCPPIDSDDDDDNGQGEDVFQPASDEDTEHNGGDEGEDEDEMSEKAKGKRKAST